MSLIDLPTAKAHLRLDDDFPDELVDPYLMAAEMAAQEFMNRLVFATEADLAAAIAGVPEKLSAAGIAYREAMEAAQAMDDMAVQCRAEAGAQFRYFQANELARATYSGIVMNDLIKAAMLLILGHLYENRQDVQAGVSSVQIPMGSQSLLWPYRVGLGA